MLNNDHRVAGVDQHVQLRHQAVDIGRVQPGGRLVQHIQRVAALRALQFGGQLDALRLTARKLGGRLAQSQVAQPDVLQQLQRPLQRGIGAEKSGRLVDTHRQHVGDRLAAQLDPQRVGVVTRAVAGRARRIDAGHEQQFDADKTFAFTSRAAALGHVERKAPGVVALVARRRRDGKQLADVIEQPGVGGQVRPRRAADRFLVDTHQALDGRRAAVVEAAFQQPRQRRLERVVGFFDGCRTCVAQRCGDQVDQGHADQAGLARARDAGHRRQSATRKTHAYPVQVVAADARHLQPAERRPRRSFTRLRHSEQVMRRVRPRHAAQPGRRPAVEHMAALLASVRPDVDDPVSAPHHVQVVLDDKQRVAGRFQARQRGDQRFAIGGVQAGGRFVQHVNHAEQVGTDLRGQAQPLQFARRQGWRAAVQRQVAQAQRLQRLDALDHVAGDTPRGDAFFVRQIGCAPHIGRAGVGRTTACHTARGVGRSAGAAEHRLAARRGQAVGCGRCQHIGQLRQRQLLQLADVEPGETHRQGFGLQALAVAGHAGRADHEPGDALFHQRAVRRGKGLQHVFAHADEGALIAGCGLAAQCGLGLCRCEAGVDRHRRLLFGGQDPVAVLARQIAPRFVDVDAQRDQDVAQVLPVPGRWPGRDGPFADAQRIVGHQRAVIHFVDPAQAVADRAGALRCVGRKVFGIQHRLRGRVFAGP